MGDASSALRTTSKALGQDREALSGGHFSECIVELVNFVSPITCSLKEMRRRNLLSRFGQCSFKLTLLVCLATHNGFFLKCRLPWRGPSFRTRGLTFIFCHRKGNQKLLGWRFVGFLRN